MCEALGQLGIWVRLHYVYPYPHVDAVIDLMAQGEILRLFGYSIPTCKSKSFKTDETTCAS